MNWIFAHLIGDYIIQNDWMANRKKESSTICLIHVLTYMIPFLFCGLSSWQFYLIAVQHFAQDRTHFIRRFFDATGKRSFARSPMAPWSLIVVDNIFHILFIALVVHVGEVYNNGN